MTDNDIIRALECCVKDDMLEANNNVCLECPMNDDNACTFNLRKYVLDFINRQKAEIERLTAMVEAAEDYLHPLPFKNAFDEEILKAKAEAVKEFAERLKKTLTENAIK